MHKIIIIIPSRYQSSRFPGKPLALIAGRTMIERVYQNVQGVDKISDVYVATDDMRIYEAVESFGGKVLMTSSAHTCGTDRIAECAEILKLDDEDIILNIQGDEPLFGHEMVKDLIDIFMTDDVYMGTLKQKIESEEELENPNVVKVLTDIHDNAIYFSRSCIPYVRGEQRAIYYKHIGAYGYKKWFLEKYSKMDRTPLERLESLEQLRVIENGYHIRVAETKGKTIGIDTPEQVKLVEEIIMREGND